MKVLTLRRPDACADCMAGLDAGARASWDATARVVRCLPCSQVPEGVAAGDGVPLSGSDGTIVAAPRRPGGGASAQREYEKRSAARERSVRTSHPNLGGLLLALSKEPVHARVWAQGAAGERAVAARLDELAGEHLIALHDRARRRPDGKLSRANIDHLVITASGVWVIDAKTHHGELEVRRGGGLFGPRVERLYIGGRDRTSLVGALINQMHDVRAQLDAAAADVPIRGALCFVGTDLPWFSSSIAGVPLVGRRGLAKLIKEPGDLAAGDRVALAQFLDGRFPPAR